ncbi:tetratricopeptide repeat protein [Leptothoe spongobia]|uniref:tetratricopeptide repeat protein n=1 Tax=Leptothoe spongobia TaxID=2651728 RepID=UPI001FE8C333
MAAVYRKLEQYEMALQYCDRALTIATELRIPLVQDCQELQEQLLHSQSSDS